MESVLSFATAALVAVGRFGVAVCILVFAKLAVATADATVILAAATLVWIDAVSAASLLSETVAPKLRYSKKGTELAKRGSKSA